MAGTTGPSTPEARAAAPAVVDASVLAGHPIFRDGPPAAVSGGFGEETCIACHFGTADENDPSGSVELAGVPDAYTPGERYTLSVTVTRPGLSAGGFQLAARFRDDGLQAGALAAGAEDGERVGFTEHREVTYAHHRLAGVIPVSADANRWTLEWTAPTSGAPVVLHLTGVAGDGDESQFGDHVFSTFVETAPGG